MAEGKKSRVKGPSGGERTTAAQHPPESSADLLGQLVAHLRENRTQLREEWARRITDPPPILVRSNGTLSEVGRPGTALGIVDKPQLEEEKLELNRGDAVILYTDGLTEAGAPRRTRRAADFGPLLKDGSPLDPESVAESLEAAVVNSEAPPRDDVAILVLAVQQ